MAITHEVYVNSVQVHIPSSLGTLSPAALAAISANHGSPYTEDYHLVLNPLEPSTVDGYLRDFYTDALASVHRAMQSAQVAQPAALRRRSASARWPVHCTAARPLILVGPQSLTSWSR